MTTRTGELHSPIRRPRVPRSADVSVVLAYLRAMEAYATALEEAITQARKEMRCSTKS